ncbi:TIGR00730 family Rossman fold protein [bacterium SCSIO 12741]|nr:TIGR00730 family Rossman fold protein [bacterium SCSIO 12741]
MGNKISSVCVFCASGEGNNPIYKKSAREAGKAIAQRGMELIYGGGKVGLMGAVADGAMEAGGKVTGIIPEFMIPHEVGHTGITDLLTVSSMHERKLEMHERSDAVLTLPGGFGTFEELFEIVTWIQLGLYAKPVALLNVNGYYDLLGQQLDLMAKEGLLRDKHRPLIHLCSNLDEVFDHFETYLPGDSIFKILEEQT